MAAAEGGGPIKQRQTISPGRHFVVDRYSAAKRDIGHAPLGRDETPPPQFAYRKCSGLQNGLADVELRIAMVALAEQERETGAVGDVLKANAAVDPEEAVPRR